MKIRKLPEIPRYMKIGAVVAVIGVLVFEYRSCTEPTGQQAAEQQALPPADSLIRGQAYFASKKYIRKALDKADSLVFPDYREVEVSISSKRLFVVNTWVDEVSAEKYHRHYYQANMEKMDELTWQCRGLTLDGDLVK
jgi:hypothetical protein